MARPKGTIISHLHQVEKLKRLYIKHAQKFGKINEQRYLGVLDGLDLAMELTQSIRTFEKDLETR
tara:strand:- start:181 stop:375 length:195 start_codon:yes stop_codon:yes gene_type:complete